MTFLVWAICVFIAVRIISDSLIKQDRDTNNTLDK